MFMKIVVVWLVFMLGMSMYNTRKQHSYVPSKDVAIIEGECVLFNWCTSEEDIELALAAWLKLRGVE